MTSYRLHLLPLAIGLIISSTLIPIELRGSAQTLSGFAASDFVTNVLLYLPLGISLSRRPHMQVALIALAIAALVEVSQLWSFSRYPSLLDVAANGFGALLGAQIPRSRLAGLAPGQVLNLDAALPFAWLLAISLSLLMLLPASSARPSNWDSSFDLIMGNEKTGDRPWTGEISAIALLPYSLSRKEIAGLDSSILDGSLASTLPRAVFVSDVPIHFGQGTTRYLPSSVAQRLFERVESSGTFSVVARIKTDEIQQSGPARWITYSADQFNRNFDLGQEGKQIVFRIRTPITGLNANFARTESDPVLEVGSQFLITATYDGSVARIFAGEKIIGRSNIAATGCFLPALCDSVLPLGRTALGASIAIIALGFFRPRQLRKVVSVSLASAGCCAIVLALIRLTRDASAYQAWTALIPILGGAFAALSYRAESGIEERTTRNVLVSL